MGTELLCLAGALFEFWPGSAPVEFTIREVPTDSWASWAERRVVFLDRFCVFMRSGQTERGEAGHFANALDLHTMRSRRFFLGNGLRVTSIRGCARIGLPRMALLVVNVMDYARGDVCQRAVHAWNLDLEAAEEAQGGLVWRWQGTDTVRVSAQADHLGISAAHLAGLLEWSRAILLNTTSDELDTPPEEWMIPRDAADGATEVSLHLDDATELRLVDGHASLWPHPGSVPVKFDSYLPSFRRDTSFLERDASFLALVHLVPPGLTVRSKEWLREMELHLVSLPSSLCLVIQGYVFATGLRRGPGWTNMER
jgi:hypothetical protein